ncbi:MAG: hypothetical protein IPH57_15745 [Saprospiraceae bacterium]|nr:hypothetical protein [Saprospiraceae bacterium]
MLLLKNAIYINWKTLDFLRTNIVVENGLSGKISFQSDNELPLHDKDSKIIDCKGKYVTKSFAVGHHHAYSSLARGMGAPKKILPIFLKYLNTYGGILTNALMRR